MSKKEANPSDGVWQENTDISTTWSENLWFRIELSVLTPFRILWNDMRGRFGLLTVAFFVLLGTVGVLVIPKPTADPFLGLVGPFQSWSHPLGTEVSGKGLLRMVVHATPPILEMVAAGAVISTTIGALVGMFSGYRGGKVDTVLMMITDVLVALPGLPLTIVLIFIFEPQSPFMVGVLLAVNSWTGLARSLRSQVLTLRDENYVEASRIMGMSTPRIIRQDILPGLMPLIATSFAQAARVVIFGSVGLYFIGVLTASQSNWGVMMNNAYTIGGALYSSSTLHWMLVPMGALVLFTLGLIMLAQGLDKVFNVQLRARHSTYIETEEEEQAGEAESA